MKHYICIFLLLLPLSACLPTAPGAAPATALSSPTLTPTITPTLMPTQTPLPTPTLAYPVSMNTPWPVPDTVIQSGNIEELEPLASFGYGLITNVAYSPDYSIFAVSTFYGFHIYDSQTFSLITSVATHSALLSLAFTPDGKTMVTGNADNVLQMWDVPGFSLIKTLEFPFDKSKFQGFDGIKAISFTPDGRFMEIMGQFGKVYVKLWDVGSEKEIATLEEVDSCNAKISPNGSEYTIATADKVGVYKIPGGEIKNEYPFYNTNNVIYSPDGRVMAVISGSVIRLINTADGLTFKKISGKYLVFSPNSTTFVTTAGEGAFSAWTVSYDDFSVSSLSSFSGYGFGGYGFGSDNCNPFVTLFGHKQREYDDNVYFGTFSPDGSNLAVVKKKIDIVAANSSSTKMGELLIYNISDGSLAQTILVPPEAYTDPNVSILRVLFSPDRIMTVSSYRAGSWDRVIRVWDLKTGGLLKEINPIRPALPLAFSPDSKYLVSYSPNGGARLFAPRTSGSDYTTREFNEMELAMWDIAQGSVKQEYSGLKIMQRYWGDDYFDAYFSPDGQFFSYDGWNISGSWDINLSQSIGTTGSVAYSGDQLKAVVQECSNVLFYNSKEQVQKIEQPDCISSLAFSKDGRLLATGDHVGKIRIWDVSSGILNKQFLCPNSRIEKVRIIPENNILAATCISTVSWGSSLSLWELNSEELITTIGGSSLNFDISPDEKLIAIIKQTHYTDVIEIYNNTGGLIRTINTPYQTTFYHSSRPKLSFSPDSTMLAMAFQGLVQIWGVGPGK